MDARVLDAPRQAIVELLPALCRLDDLLERAIAAATSAFGSAATGDPFRGLHLSSDDVAVLLDREPSAPLLWTGSEESADEVSAAVTPAGNSHLSWLKSRFGLTPFEIDVLLIALAPELDLRYERLFAYLQDDVTRKRPSVDLVLNLLCPSPEVKLARRIHFAADAPLFSNRLLHTVSDSNQDRPPLLARFLQLDEQLVGLLVGQHGMDSRLARFTEVVQSDCTVAELPLDRTLKLALPNLITQARAERRALRLYFQGPPGIGKHRAAASFANELGIPLIAAELDRALTDGVDFEQALALLFREAWFRDAILYLDGIDSFRTDERAYRRILDSLSADGGITILGGTGPWRAVDCRPVDVLSVPFTLPDFSQRRACWQADLAARGLTIEGHELDALAGRFRLTPSQVDAAAASAVQQIRLQKATRRVDRRSRLNGESILPAVFSAARDQSSHDLAVLTQKLEPRHTWDDIVLPVDTLAQLREICQRVVHRHRVFNQWGFDSKLSLGKGVSALFTGPPGTGKTMAAEVIANELGLDLYKIDLSGVVSKYIGETEKNLDRIFAAAENANAILLFDEADALFGKRAEVRDSHDRYSNIEVCYLLQKMEQFDGIAFLTTNQRQNMDAAFTRRLAFTVHFPFPDEVSRQQIWKGIWPVETPLGDEVDLESVAGQFKLSGGNIKNIALAASFLAAQDNKSIAMTHLLQATRREFQKMGKALSETELKPTDAKAVQAASASA